ncbi:MAG: hypothetical protein ACTSO6_11530 [Promethearchaeota archaeon]
MDILSGEISSMIFERVVKHDIGDFSLDSQMLSVVTELDGKKSLGIIAKKTGFSMGVMREVVSKLLRLELIEPIEDVVSEVDELFFSYLKEQLSLAVGPIAEIIIEEEITDLGYDPLKFPSKRAAELVDLVSREIQREEKKTLFKQNMIKENKEKGY